MLSLLPAIVLGQEEINDAISTQLELLRKKPKDKEALRKVSFLFLNKADYNKAILYGQKLFDIGYAEEDYNHAVIYSHICLGQAQMMKGNTKEAYSHLAQAQLIGESNKNDSASVQFTMGWAYTHPTFRKTTTYHSRTSSKEWKLLNVLSMTGCTRLYWST